MLEILDPESYRLILAGASVGALTATALSLIGWLERQFLDQPSKPNEDGSGEPWLPRPLRRIGMAAFAGGMVGWAIADHDGAVFYFGLLAALGVVARGIWQIAHLDTAEQVVGEAAPEPDPDQFFETPKGRAWGEVAFGALLLLDAFWLS